MGLFYTQPTGQLQSQCSAISKLNGVSALRHSCSAVSMFYSMCVHKRPVWWGVHIKQGGTSVHLDSGANRVTTSSLIREVAAVIHATQWLAFQCDAQITHAIILTDPLNLLQKVVSEMGCPDWHTATHSLRLQRFPWIYCPGHAGVSGNERADRHVSTADIN